MDIFKVIRKQPCKWNQSDTLKWLELIGMKQYEHLFRENSVDGSILMDLNETDLKDELGIINDDDREIIWRSIKDEMPKILTLHREKEEYQKFKIERVANDISYKYEVSEDLLKEVRQKNNIPNDWEICTDKKEWGWVITDEDNYFLSIYHYEHKENMQVQVKETSNQQDVSLGRDPAQNQISTDHKYMDPIHAKIIFDKEERQYWFMDYNSIYGSYVRVSANSLSLLDEYVIGNSVIKINKILRNALNPDQVDLELTIFTEKGVSKVLLLSMQKGRQYWIGRETGLDVVLEDKEVSKKHSYFSMNQSEILIIDNNSKNMLWKKINKIALNNPGESSSSTAQLKLGRERFSFIVYKQKKQKYMKEIHDALK